MKIRFFTALIAVVLVAGVSKAEINVGESIEWIVADSDQVIIGKITKVEKAGAHELVTVDVSKTIRGKHVDQVQFVVRSSGRPVADNWRKVGMDMLFCLSKRENVKDNGNLPAIPLVLRHGYSGHSAVMLGKTDQQPMEVFTREFGVLTDPAAIVKHVESYAKSIPADWKKKRVTVDVPFDSPAHKKLYAGSSVLFELPADAALEAQGRKWCKSDRGDNRTRGIQCLKHFPNDENVKIITGLLTDENIATGGGKKYYYVRTKAYEALREMGVAVARPILEEPAK